LEKNIILFDIEVKLFKKPIYSKSNGCYSILISFSEDYKIVKIKLSSNQLVFINNENFCIVGRNNYILWKYIKFKKASFFKKLGYKQKVRGVAMNPVDHPHGGRSKTNSPEVSIWGWVTKFSH
jgi:large subunit ribosomal protein L2